MKRVMMALVLLLLTVSLAVPAVGAAGFFRRQTVQKQTEALTCGEGCRFVDGNGDGLCGHLGEKNADCDAATCRKGGSRGRGQARGSCQNTGRSPNAGHCGRR